MSTIMKIKGSPKIIRKKNQRTGPDVSTLASSQ
jgi:hypothetical protein